MFRIITLKQKIFSQSDPVLIRQSSKKLQSDPVLIWPQLASPLIQSDPVLIRAHQWCTDMEILQSWSNPKLFPRLHIQSISKTAHSIAHNWYRLFCLTRQKLWLFCLLSDKVVEVVTWKVGYDAQKTRAEVWDWAVRFSLQFTHCRQEQVTKSLSTLKRWHHSSTKLSCYRRHG